ncbi:MAG: hypothetical protein WCG85_05745 [Polyangia bacterium]
MNKFHGKSVAGLAAIAFFGALGSAQAQDQGMAPAPAYAPPPAAAPAGSDSMAGQFGIGVGVGAGGTTLVTTRDAEINMKYWLSDVLAVMPQLALGVFTQSGLSTGYQFAPAALVLYCPWKTTSTRLSVGGGLGLDFEKKPVTSAGPPPTVTMPTNSTIAITLPIYVGVEHFFTKWFSMGIAVQNDFLSYTKFGPAHSFDFGLDTTATTKAVAFLFFYTD